MIVAIFPSLTALGGGLELYDRQFVEALVRNRPGERIVTVLAREPSLARPELLSDAARAQLEVIGASSNGRLTRIVQLIAQSILAGVRHRPTLVICGHVNFAPLARMVAALSRARLLTLTYGIESWAAKRRDVQAALERSDVIVSISAFTAAQLLRSFKIPAERVVVVPNAVDTTRFRPGPPSARVEQRLAHLPRPRLLTVARLDATERYKGVDQVIRALATPTLSPRPSYVVVGSGTDAERLRELATRLGVAVDFYGQAAAEDLADLYRACDVFVMPSRNEGFGYVFIEAMASGIPVVAGGVDGSVDALAGGRLGLLVNPLDTSAIADAIEAHVRGDSPPEMRDARRLHDEVHARFSMDAFTRNLAHALALLDRSNS